MFDHNPRQAARSESRDRQLRYLSEGGVRWLDARAVHLLKTYGLVESSIICTGLARA
jgi:hypothetical protein